MSQNKILKKNTKKVYISEIPLPVIAATITIVEIIIPPAEISMRVLLAVLSINFKAMYVAITFIKATKVVPTKGSVWGELEGGKGERKGVCEGEERGRGKGEREGRMQKKSG